MHNVEELSRTVLNFVKFFIIQNVSTKFSQNGQKLINLQSEKWIYQILKPKLDKEECS